MRVLAFVGALAALTSGAAGSVANTVRESQPRAAASVVGAIVPVDGTVVQRFIAPSCEKCRGPRGVTFRTREGSVVRAAMTGEVSFVGQVSRRLYVVQRLGNGVLLTYGWLAATNPALTAGRPVPRGAELGASGSLFYLGARVKGRYVDPLVLLGFGRVRLVGPGAIGRAVGSR